MNIKSIYYSEGKTLPFYIVIMEGGELFCIYGLPPYEILWDGKYDPILHKSLQIQPKEIEEVPFEVLSKLRSYLQAA